MFGRLKYLTYLCKTKQIKTKIMEQYITLGKQVTVSDPGFFGQKDKDLFLNLNIRPGEYRVKTTTEDFGFFGKRIGEIQVRHKDFIDEYLTWDFEGYLMVDGGFMSVYNKNTCPMDFETLKANENVALCSSGIGDGTYPVIVGRYRRQIVSIVVDFTFDDEDEDDEE